MRPIDREVRDMTNLKAGDKAPDFKLESHLEQEVRLSDFAGKKNIVLAFFPEAWTPI